MQNNSQDNRFEQLYDDMRAYALDLHERNKNRIKYGTILLILLPLILGLIRWLTDSDKVLFLLIWVLCLFLVAAYLIGVEYLDYSIQKKLTEMTDKETEFDDLLGTEQRAAEISAKARETSEKARERFQHFYEARVAELQQTGVLQEQDMSPLPNSGTGRQASSDVPLPDSDPRLHAKAGASPEDDPNTHSDETQEGGGR